MLRKVRSIHREAIGLINDFIGTVRAKLAKVNQGPTQ